jgi:hypothetical protein
LGDKIRPGGRMTPTSPVAMQMSQESWPRFKRSWGKVWSSKSQA